MLQVLGLALATPTRRAALGRPHSPPSPPCLKADVAGHWSPDRLRQCRTHDLDSVSESPDRGSGRGAPSWERVSGRLLGSGSDQSGPDSEARPETRSRGNGDSAVSQSTHSAEPTVALSGPAGRAYRSAARGYGAGEAGTRRPASSPLEQSSRPPARRAVGTAAVRSGSRPNRGGAWTGETAA